MADISLSPELRQFIIDSTDNAIRKTIKDGELDINAPNYNSPDLLSIAEHLEKEMLRKKKTLNGKDRRICTFVITSVRQMIRHRKLTMGFTTYIATVTDLIRYVIIWLNTEKGFNLDVKIMSRRKSLIGELKKILLKSLEHVNDPELMFTPPVIRDRFGLRLLISQDNPALLLSVVAILIAILTNPESDEFLEFTTWLSNVNQKFGGEEVPKEKLLQFFKQYHMDLSHVKNYVTNPKPSTYESWQGTLTVDATSLEFCGFMFELQVRTSAMHKNAEYGPASHDAYKQKREELVKGLFEIHDYKGGIVHYEGPDFPDLDLDGLSVSANILSRHVSRHVAATSPNAEF